MNLEDIVVGIDGSVSAEFALDWAADEAVRRACRLVLVHASAVVDSAAYSSTTLDMMRADAINYGDRILAEARAAVAAKYPQLPVDVRLRHQRPADLLIELSGPHSMVVLGNRGGGRLTGALLGSVSQRVAAHALGTVVVVGDGRQNRSRRSGILVGVSDSAGGRAALDFACEEALQRGCRLTAVRAYGVFGRSRHSQIYPELPGLHEHEAANLLNVVSRLRVMHPELDLAEQLIDVPATEALAELACDAELLVLGCRHPDDRWPSRLGPITAALLHHSPCPVVIVGIPHPAAADVAESSAVAAESQPEASAEAGQSAPLDSGASR